MLEGSGKANSPDHTSSTEDEHKLNNASIIDTIFSNISFGVVSGSLIDHTTTQVALNITPIVVSRIKFYNCTWGVATKLSLSSIQPYFVGYSKDGGIEDTDYSEILYGKLTHNTSAGDGGSDCLEITPTGNTNYCDTSNYIDYLPMFQCPAQDGVSRTAYVKLKKTATLDSTVVAIALYQNSGSVVAWTTCAGISDSTYTEYSLNYIPTEDGILDMAIKLDGDAGSLYVDSFRWT